MIFDLELTGLARSWYRREQERPPCPTAALITKACRGSFQAISPAHHSVIAVATVRCL